MFLKAVKAKQPKAIFNKMTDGMENHSDINTSSELDQFPFTGTWKCAMPPSTHPGERSNGVIQPVKPHSLIWTQTEEGWTLSDVLNTKRCS